MGSKYIPGLTQRPPDSEWPEREYEETEDDILVKEFKKSKKNPTMCLHEYCARNKLELKYEEEEAEYKPGYLIRYGVRVYVDGLKHRQGVGGNKKEAKNEASRLAFRAVMGMDNFEPEEQTTGSDVDEILEVRRLKYFCQEQNLIYEKTVIRDKEGMHICTVLVAGIEQICEKHSIKEEAVFNAHSKALQMLGQAPTPHRDTLFEEGAFPSLEPTVPCPEPELAQRRQEMVYEMLELRLQQLPFLTKMEHHIAAFFLCNDQNGVGELVALGTGNSSIHAEHITMDGRCMLDSSGITVAKRSLRRYLAQEMVRFYENKSSVFCQALDESGKIQLSSGTTIHLFLSHPPGGDYQDFIDKPTVQTSENLSSIQQGAHIPTFEDDLHGMFKCRSEEGAVESTQNTPDQTSLSQVKQANEMRVMTESDKLLRWNILGLQGAALGLFTHPIYLSSISVGFNPQNDHGHLTRAVCCRVYEDLQAELPEPYTIAHPVIQFCPRPVQKSLSTLYQQASNFSINWNGSDARLEIVDGDKGRTNEHSPFKSSKSASCASRLCKAALHVKWFFDVCKSENKGKAAFFSGQSPSYVKRASVSYEAAKQSFYKHCQEFGVGKWIHAPAELSMFIK